MNTKKLIMSVLMFFRWIYVKIFWRLFYDKKYLAGRWFDEGINSIGWLWASRDIHFRFKTLRHLGIRWPVAPEMEVGPNIIFDPDDLNNMNSFGCYFQTMDGEIKIGKGTYIAPNVGIITANHDIHNLDEHIEGKNVVLGKQCWIGMNSIILPGVELGDNTIVGAGSVVTKSFPEGNSIIAGNPAKIIKKTV